MNASAGEEKLRESQTLYRALFDATRSAYLVLAPDAPHFTIIDVNHAYLRATMTERETLIGRGVFEVFPANPADADDTGVHDLRASFDRVLATHRPDTMPVLKYDIRRPDGSFEVRQWIPYNTPILNNAGEVLGIIHHAQDVTEYVQLRERGTTQETEHLEEEIVAAADRLHQTNERLRESEERHRFQLHLTDTLRPIAEADRIKQEAMRVMGERIGASRVLYFDMTDTHYFVQNDYTAGVRSIAGNHTIASFGTNLLAAYQSGKTVISDDVEADPVLSVNEREAFAGIQTRAHICVPLIKNGLFVAGMAVHMNKPRNWKSLEVALVQDTAERTWAAVERAHAESMMHEQQARLLKVEKLASAGQLAASLAHEINNPLSSIVNILYLLETDPDLDKAVKEHITTASTELDRVSRIVKQSLSYYRVDTVPVSLVLGQITRDSLKIYGEKLQQAGITLKEDVRSESTLLGFPSELRQVIDNLLLNALQAMPKGGRLTVSVRDASEWRENGIARKGLRITLADTGCGIPKEIRRRIFEPFFTTKSGKGTGLGLWVIQGIVAKHEGKIQVRSSDDSGRSGTVISMFLPSHALRK